MKRKRYVPRALVPYRRLLRLKYQEDITLAVTSGALTTYAFSLNSLYDTNQTGTGLSVKNPLIILGFFTLVINREVLIRYLGPPVEGVYIAIMQC